MRLKIKRSQSNQGPDLENGTRRNTGELPTSANTQEDINAENQTSNNDADNNDKFWKLFHEEAVSEAKWKVSIWQTELDSLLVFTGLFAGVVSAFLIDLRSHLGPDPQVSALTEIISILRNETAPANTSMDRTSSAILTAGFLWYGSLVFTLIGALWGVLAKSWLGEILRETPNNPADRALERWRRDKAAKNWYMANVITGVPLLTQIGLAMFLSGFVVQSFDDNHAIGLVVLVFVSFGAFAYAAVTWLPWLRPDCPFQTPLTKFLNLVPQISVSNITDDANTDAKMQILVSRLNRSSNDEIFCSAAAMLDGKLESGDWKSWYQGLKGQSSEIADALSVRLKNFAHRVETIAEGPSFSKDMVRSGINRDAFLGALHLPIEQGIACLRVLLKSIEASMSSDGKSSPFYKQDSIDHQWMLPKTFPETWRLLSLSIHFTRLVAKEIDYYCDNDTEIDWENIIQETRSDPALRSILGVSACRGLLQGQENLKRVCALGLATFIEITVTAPVDSPKQFFDDKVFAVEKGKDVIERLWTELVKIWRNAVVQLIHGVHERDEFSSDNAVVKLLQKELYQSSDITSSISQMILLQLESKNWTTQRQGIQILTQLSEYVAFRTAVNDSGAIHKLIEMLSTNSDYHVRAASTAALLALSAHESYQTQIKSFIPTMLNNLGNRDADIRIEIIHTLTKLSELEIFREKIQIEGVIFRFVAKLTDKISGVRAAAINGLLAFRMQEIYQSNIKLYIPTMIEQLDDKNWTIRLQAINMLVKLSELNIFLEAILIEGVVAKFTTKLADEYRDIRAAAIAGLIELSANRLSHDKIKLSIPVMAKYLDSDDWEIRAESIEMFAKLSEPYQFHKMIVTEGIIPKFIAKLVDKESIVRTAAVVALLRASAHKLYQKDIMLSFPIITKQLSDTNQENRIQTIGILVNLSKHEVFHRAIHIEGAVHNLIAMLVDNDSDVRVAAVAALRTFRAHKQFYSDIKTSIPTIIRQLDDENRRIRTQAIQILLELSELEEFRESIHVEGTILKCFAMLTYNDREVQAVAAIALLAFSRYEYYQNDIKSSIPNMAKQLDDKSSTTQRQVIDLLAKLCNNVEFREAINIEGIIPKFVAKLMDNESNVRAAAVTALLEISTQALYQDDVKLSIPTIVKQLNDKKWGIRTQSIYILVNLFENEVYRETIQFERIIPTFVSMLTDNDLYVRTAAFTALLTFSTDELYQNDVKSSIPTIIKQMGDFRVETINMLAKLSEIEVFRKVIYTEATIPKLVTMLMDSDHHVRTAAVVALRTFSIYEIYQNDIKLSISTIIGQLDNIHVETINMVAMFSEFEVFRETIQTEGALPKFITKLTDNDPHVRAAALAALQVFSTHDIYRKNITLSIPIIIKQLDDDIWIIRRQAMGMLALLSKQVAFQETIKINGTIPKLISKLEDEGEDVRAVAVQVLSEFGTQSYFRETMNSENAVSSLFGKLSDASARVQEVAINAISTLSKHEPYVKDIKSTMSTSISTIVKQLQEQSWRTRNQAVNVLRSEQLAAHKLFQEIIKTDKVIPKLIAKLMDNDSGVRSSVYEALAVLGTQEDVTEFLQTIVSMLSTINKPGRMEVYKILVGLRDSRAAFSRDTFLKEIDTAICELLIKTKDSDLSFVRRAIAILTETTDEGLRGNDLQIPSPANQLARDAIESVVRASLVYDKNSPDRNKVILALSRIAKHNVFLGCLKPAIPGLIEAMGSSDRKIWSTAVGAITALSRQDQFHSDISPALQKLIQKMSGWEDNESYQLNVTSNKENDSLTEDLIELVVSFIEHGHLTMNDRIAFASSLRIVSPVPVSSEIRVCKLNMAALLIPKPTDTFSEYDYSSFLGVILGNGNDILNSKLSMLFTPEGPAT